MAGICLRSRVSLGGMPAISNVGCGIATLFGGAISGAEIAQLQSASSCCCVVSDSQQPDCLTAIGHLPSLQVKAHATMGPA